MANSITTETKTMLFHLVGHSLFSMPLELPETIDWEAVISQSHAQAVSTLAFEHYQELGLSEELTLKLKKYLKKCTVSNFNCFHGHKYLHEILTKNGIPYCILKGAASARYYPNPLLRAMGDVDFYVPPEYTAQARDIFSAEGFQFKNEDHRYHISIYKDAMRLEMHFAPIALPQSEMASVFFEYWSDLLEGASLVQDVFSEYVLPSDFHHGFILLTHFQAHLISIGVGLRHVCDWAVFANSFSNDEFVALFEERLKRVGLWRLAQVLSLVAVRYLGMPHKPWMGEDYALATALMEDIWRGGNFGVGEKSKSIEAMLIADSPTASIHKSRIVQAFRSLNIVVRSHWSAAKRCPLLYPVGWIYFSARFLVRVMTGRREGNLIKVYAQSGKRKKLYRRLRMYEAEKIEKLKMEN